MIRTPVLKTWFWGIAIHVISLVIIYNYGISTTLQSAGEGFLLGLTSCVAFTWFAVALFFNEKQYISTYNRGFLYSWGFFRYHIVASAVVILAAYKVEWHLLAAIEAVSICCYGIATIKTLSYASK